MHEYLLFSQIPNSRHEQVINILAGVTATIPTEYGEQHLIYHPQKAPEVKPSKKAPKSAPAPTQQRPIVQHVIRGLAQPAAETSNGKTALNGDIDYPRWTLRIAETPEPGVPGLISRTASEAQLQPEDAERLQDASATRFAGTHVLAGTRCIHNNIIVRVYRMYLAPAAAKRDDASGPLSAAPPDLEALKLVDVSGAFVVEACVRVEDKGDSKLLEKAREELLGFKRMLEGAIDLRVPDRLSLDTRVKVN